MRNVIIATVGILVIGGGGLLYWIGQPIPTKEVSVSPQVENLVQSLPEPVKVDPVKPVPVKETPEQPVPEPAPQLPEEVSDGEEGKIEIPTRVKLDVPFIVQAPFGNWELPFKEACEEASALMVHHFLQGTKSLSQEQMKLQIEPFAEWEYANHQSYDSNAEQVKEMFTEYFTYDEEKVHVVSGITIEDIKAVLAKGYPVIVPAAGRDLGNRYFQTPGPLYHMLVIIGYDENDFITHDPGTRNGANYRYSHQALYNAIHDLTPVRENIREGRKAMVVVTQ